MPPKARGLTQSNRHFLVSCDLGEPDLPQGLNLDTGSFIQALTNPLSQHLLNTCVPGSALDQSSADSSLQVKPGPLLAFVNKVLLAHSHAHSFTYCLWLLFLQQQSQVVATE